MANAPQPVAREVFPNWFTATAHQGEGFWNTPVDWDDHDAVGRLVSGLEADIDVNWNLPPDGFTQFAAAVITDLCPIEQRVHAPFAISAIAMHRFFAAAAALRHAVIHGRPNLIYNWLMCSICDRPYADVEPGVPIDVTEWPGRPVEFLTSACPAIKSTAYEITAKWFADVYYAAWKYSLRHELADLVLSEARRVIGGILEAASDPVIIDAIEAAAHLAAWFNQTGNPEAKAIAEVLVRVYERPAQVPGARKAAGMALSTLVGRHTSLGPAQWAARTLADCGTELVQHEEFQLLSNSCANPQQVGARFPELLSSAERLSQLTVENYGPNPAAIAFRRSQLFDIVAPSVRNLISLGRCRDAIDLVGAWFGVPKDLRRKSPVLAVVPGHDEGVLYAVDGFSKLYRRDTAAAMRRLTTAINKAFDMSIALRHERELPPARVGQRPRPGWTDELAEATLDYYATASLEEFICEAPVVPAGSFHPHAEHTPFQPATERVLGLTWPIVTSFQEPQPDRPVRRAFLWTCGTYLGDFEIQGVAANLRARGVECVVRAGTDLTREQFLEVYRDGTFDVIWANAHGMFDPRAPHLAYMKLSVDERHTVSVSDMLRHPVPGSGRRLLILNICLGGSVLVTGSPACLGMGAMLASANQAVVAHLVEVHNRVAPLFGALLAVGLRRAEAFFPAFRYAVGTLPSDHETTLDLLRKEAPECGELIERLGRSSPGVDQSDIRTWGTPVFFE